MKPKKVVKDKIEPISGPEFHPAVVKQKPKIKRSRSPSPPPLNKSAKLKNNRRIESDDEESDDDSDMDDFIDDTDATENVSSIIGELYKKNFSYLGQ